MANYDFTDQERDDLIRAIKDAQDELCLAPNMTESHAINERWEVLKRKLEGGC